MDGANVSRIVMGLKDPRAIVIDFQASKLYWTDFDASKIQYSYLDGGKAHTILENLAGPMGIALIGGKMFWGDWTNKTLQASARGGTDISAHHTDTYSIRYLTVGPDLELPRNRSNPCEGQKCSSICVLTTTSYRCLTQV